MGHDEEGRRGVKISENHPRYSSKLIHVKEREGLKRPEKRSR